MDMYIKDPVTSDAMRVTEEGRATIDSVLLPKIAHVSQKYGEAFILASGFIALTTTASFNGMMYFKNTDAQNRNFKIHHFRACGGLCAAGSTLQVVVYINPTTGTLISDAVAGYENNMNTTNSNTLGGLLYAPSGDGKTVTDGTYFTQFINHAPGHSIQEYDGGIVIGKNKSFTIVVKPSVAMTVCIELIGYYD